MFSLKAFTDQVKKHRVLGHVLFWLLILSISVIENLYYNHYRVSFGFALMDCLLGLVTQVLAAYFLAYFIIPRFYQAGKYIQVVLFFLAGSYLLCVLGRFLTVRVAEPLAGVAPKDFETNAEILTNIPKLLFVYFFRIFSVAFVFVLLKLLKDQNDMHQHTLSLQKEKVETELKLLKMQLNPHFLFNTLNNIYSLTVTQSPIAPASISRLSDILDHVLYRCSDPFVPLSSEITLLNNYIELEKLRYDERLTIDFQANAEKDVLIAPLLLLSIVENAFKHGVSENAGNSFIYIDLKAKDGLFEFKVINSHTGIPADSDSKRIGLFNLQRQLDLIYPEQYTLKVIPEPGWFSVCLMIRLLVN